MKKFTIIALLLLLGFVQSSFATDGYKVQVKLTGANDSMVYLAYYYAKGLPTIYKADSAKFNKNGIAVLQSKEKTVGGIYIILLSDKKTYFEFLLNNGDNMDIAMPASDIPYGVKFKNSTENEHFQEYEKFLKDYGEKERELNTELASAKSSTDSAAARKNLSDQSKVLIDYRNNFANKYPGSLLASIFKALEVPHVPEGKHYLPNGQEDSMFAANYYKAHYWDGFNFQDDRLIHTPIYDAKLSEYINKMTYPYTDSIEKEANMLLTKTKGTQELFKYTLAWFNNWSQESKVMGMDEVFVYLVENYYMKGYATWETPDNLSKIIQRAEQVAPNVIGNVAPEMKMNDIDGKSQSLLDLKAKYTLVVFWSPTCGFCQHEIPEIDSLYRTVLKDKGVKVFAVRDDEDKDVKVWKDFIDKNKLNDWVNVWDPERKADFQSKYDAYNTPTIYLLDDKKIIRGKKLDHTNIAEVIKMLEAKEKMQKNSNTKS